MVGLKEMIEECSPTCSILTFDMRTRQIRTSNSVFIIQNIVSQVHKFRTHLQYGALPLN